MLKLSLHLGERRHRICRQMHTGKTQVVRVLNYVDEGDDAGPALRGIKPIPLPWIIADVRVAAPPDPDPVETVIENRNPDEANFKHEDERQAVQELDLRAVGVRAFEGLRVRDEVLEQKCANGDDAPNGFRPGKASRGDGPLRHGGCLPISH